MLVAQKHTVVKTNTIFAFCCVVLACSYNEGFFWDNVLFASKMGNQLFQQGIFNWFLPDIIDPGHPPLLAGILAFGWHIFGRSLLVSHILMMPFVFGLIWQLHSIALLMLKHNRYAIAATVLALADPTLSAQMVQVGPEVLLLFFFLVTIHGTLINKAWLQSTGLFFLAVVSLRGMMLCGGVLLFDVCFHIFIKKQKNSKAFLVEKLIIYAAGALPALLFLCWHYSVKGWIIQTQANSPWATYAHIVNLKEFLRNIVIIIQRYADFGRCFILAFICIFLMLKRKQIWKDDIIRTLVSLSFLSTFFIVCYSLFSTNAMGHRYFLPAYITITLLACRLLFMHAQQSKKLVFIALLVGLISGNFWVYPETVAQGWDASLAHMPYFPLRSQAISYFDKKHINIDSVATFFPNINTLDDVMLNGDKRSFSMFNGNNLYVLYANVYNLSDDDYAALKTNYLPVKTYSSLTVKVVILQHK